MRWAMLTCVGCGGRVVTGESRKDINRCDGRDWHVVWRDAGSADVEKGVCAANEHATLPPARRLIEHPPPRSFQPFSLPVMGSLHTRYVGIPSNASCELLLSVKASSVNPSGVCVSRMQHCRCVVTRILC